MIACLGLLTACTSEAEPEDKAELSPIEISNLKIGNVCFKDNTGKDGNICRETNEIFVAGDNTCYFSGREMPCTWYGFEFDYNNPKNINSMSCLFESNRPYTSGNPNEIRAEETYSDAIDIPLEPGKNRFFNPQFVGLSYGEEGRNKTVHTTTCSIEGIELFTFELTIVYPTKN